MTGGRGIGIGRGATPARRRRVAFAAGLVALALAAAGCSSDNGSAAPETRATTTTTTVKVIDKVTANLMITGARTATVIGTKGKCTISKFGAPVYELSGIDYPALGAGGSISIAGPTSFANGTTLPANAKVTITAANPADNVGFLTPTNATGITVARNKMLVTVDVPLAGGLGGAEDINLEAAENDLQARMTGTIRCSAPTR